MDVMETMVMAPQSNSLESKKKIYRQPVLKTYGSVKTLTGAGSVSTGENPGSMAANMA